MRRAGDIVREWQALPIVPRSELPACRRMLVVAPHPDDETLGCGGLIAASCSVGQAPIVAILTDGAASHPNLRQASRPVMGRMREHEVRQAVACLGLPPTNLVLLGFPDRELAAAEAACVRQLAWLARANHCDAVVATWGYDPHTDHQAAARIARLVARENNLPLLAYPIWAWMLHPDTTIAEEPSRCWRVDISAHLPAKRRALVAHESQYFGLPEDPARFCLPAELLAVAQLPYEIFIMP